MSPSAKELGLSIGNVGILHPYGKKKLNEHFNLGAKTGNRVLIVEPARTACLPRKGQLVGRLEKTEVDFAFSSDWKLFYKSSK